MPRLDTVPPGIGQETEYGPVRGRVYFVGGRQ